MQLDPAIAAEGARWTSAARAERPLRIGTIRSAVAPSDPLAPGTGHRRGARERCNVEYEGVAVSEDAVDGVLRHAVPPLVVMHFLRSAESTYGAAWIDRHAPRRIDAFRAANPHAT